MYTQRRLFDYEKTGLNELGERLILPIVIDLAIIAIVGIIWLWSQSLRANDAVTNTDQGREVEILEKYDQHMRTATALHEMFIDIIVHIWNIGAMEELHSNDDSSDWPLQDTELYTSWKSELTELESEYTKLATTYNAQMKEGGCPFEKPENLPRGTSILLPCKFGFLNTTAEGKGVLL